MTTEQHRLVMIATILGMVVLVIFGALVLVQPQLAGAAAVDEQRAALEQQADATRVKLADLKTDSKRLPELEEQLDALRASIPASLDSSAYLTGLGDLAASSGVSLTSIVVNDAQPYAVAGEIATDASGAPAIATDNRITADNFILIPVSLAVTGSWDQVLAFLDGLQHGSRLFLVTNYSTSGGGDGGLVAQIAGYIYVIPTGATGHPAPVTFPTPSATPSETPTPDPTDAATEEPDPAPTGTPAP